MWRHRERPVLADDPPHLGLDRALLVVGDGPVQREVEPQVLWRDERARLARLRPHDIAKGPVQQVGARVVAHRPRAPVGVHDRVDRLADPDAAVEPSPVDEQPADRLLCVEDVHDRRAAAGLPKDPAVTHLAAALTVERRAVEHDLHLAGPGELAELHAVSEDRDDARLGARRLVADERGLAGPAEQALVERRELRVARQLRLPAGPAARPLLRERDVVAGTVHGDPVLRRELDREVHRESVRVVEAEGDGAGEHRRVRRQLLGPAADDAIGRRSAG